MLWMLVILLIGGLSFVIFHKPHVNVMGAGWVPPEKRVDAKPQAQLTDASAEDAVTAPVAKASPMPDTFDFNDLFGGPKNQGPTDHPNA
jgi:hypothetical protein